VFSAVPKEKLLKVAALEADIEQPGLGLSNDNRERLLKSHVSIVFHVAASVRFNKPLNAAIKANTLAVLGVLQLCHELPQIEVKKTECQFLYSSEVCITFMVCILLRVIYENI
jgi:thioester reductase-like protein